MADLHLGATVDATHQRTERPAQVATSDLVTHGVIVGMTGSGKTGLGVVLIEEVLSSGVPALVIDPKGDLTNLLLTFPDLAPADFRPWVNEADAQKAGITVDELAAQQAQLWRDGLASWNVAPEHIRALRNRVDLAIYTPGSRAGIPLNIVGSLQAPKDLSDMEVVHDEIGGFVTGLLGLVGIDADPLSSREHILLTNLIELAWSQGRDLDLDLATLVSQIPQPPLRKLGVFEVDQFFPEKDRMALAMKLNGLLASPAFAAWSDGPALDIGSLLRTPDGRPRCAVITIAHLSDEERQFLVSMLLGKAVSWMRAQSGTTDLRALIYMDEVAGYVPPTANPPTKGPIMLLMKQARAFGVGVVLSTQNPVDVDYKALSNAGTWMIGRLQTERDKARLLDGMSAAAGGVDVKAVGDTISGLGKREFVLRKAGKDQPEVMTTRWAMSYLRGPLTRDQIATLMAPARDALGTQQSSVSTPSAPASATASSGGAAPLPPSRLAPGSPLPPPPPPGAVAGVVVPPPPTAAVPSTTPTTPAPLLADDETAVMPKVAAGVLVRHLSPAAPWVAQVGGVVGGRRLQACAVARVRTLFDDEKAGLRETQEYEAVISPLPAMPDASGHVAVDYDDRDLVADAPAGAVYVLPEAPIGTKAYWTALQRSLVDDLVARRTIEVPANRALKLFGRVGETPEEFQRRCDEAADAGADADLAKLRTKYEPRLQRAKDAAATAAMKAQQSEAAQREANAVGVMDTVGDLLGGFLGGRRSARSMARTASSRAKQSSNASRRAASAGHLHEQKQAALDDLEGELAVEIDRINSAWDAKASQIDTLIVPLEKNDVSVIQLALVWLPTG